MAIFVPVYNTAGVVKLVDTLDLGSSASRRGGSSPFTRTEKPSKWRVFFMPFIQGCVAMNYC